MPEVVYDNNIEMVHLAVPKHLYGKMVQSLANLMLDAQNVHVSSASATSTAVPWPTEDEERRIDDIDWSNVENCRRLRQHLKNEAALAMLDMAAENPRSPIYISDVMERTHCSHGQASSGNGAITKAIRMVFNSKSQWPAPFNWDKEKGVACYKMNTDVAQAWNRAKIPLRHWTLNADLGHYSNTSIVQREIEVHLSYKSMDGLVSEIGHYLLDLDKLADINVVNRRPDGTGYEVKIVRDDNGSYWLSPKKSVREPLENYKSRS